MQLPLRQVAGDLRERDQFSILIAQRRNDDVRPEPRAVLAHSPAFILEAAFPSGDLELMRGPAALDSLTRVEHREVTADDVVRRVALDLACAGVPRQNATFRIEEENRVILCLLGGELEEDRVHL